MIGYITAAVALVGLGSVASFLVLVSLGIHREERARSMTVRTPDRVARGARVTNGVHARYPGVLHEAAAYRHDLPRPTDREC